MSGGVDSSVAACLLKEQGYDVIGVTMQIWQDEAPESVSEQGGCCGLSAVEDARYVARLLDIPYYVMNFKARFQTCVMDYFVNEYLQGRTPNPCIACNRYVKWEALLARSLEIGADYIATGHYAGIEQLANGRYAIAMSEAAGKDQTYALYNLTQYQLAHTRMPLGRYTKGEVLGRHRGITHYTVGQRKGLGLSMGHPVFVLEIRPDTNEVVIGENEDVFTKELVCDQLNRMAVEEFRDGDRFLAKIRYGHRGTFCRIERTGEDSLHCVFEEPVRTVTPGQAVVFYKDRYVAGGGTIRG